MSLQASAALVRNQDFMDRLTVAITQTALQIAGEAVTPGYEVYHQKRQALARAVLSAPPAQAGRFAWAVAANNTIATGGIDSPSLDGDIAFVLTTVWDDLADVQSGEAPA